MKKKAKKIVDRVKSLPPSRKKRAGVKQGAPRITNETIAEHRDEVLSSARKYIYPLQHSRHRIVTISISIFTIAVIAFFSYTILALYKFHTTSTFMYRVTQVIPFPVAKAGGSWVAYENYLFEVRRYMHYYQSQQQVDFNSKAGKSQLVDFQKRALDNVVDAAYVKQLAKKNDVSVSRSDVNEQVALLRAQNRLGGSDQVFEDVLKEFWGWSVADFQRELKQQLLAQKVVSKLDTDAHKHANDYLAQLQAGADFATVAKEHSDDQATKPNGGDYGITIERTNRDLQPKVVQQLFKLQPGQVSRVIETPVGLEIVKMIENNNGKVRASHIFVEFKPASTYINPQRDASKPKKFIGL
jgi:hypothetical protein